MSKLTRNSLIVAFFFLIDKVLAFVRTGIISRQYSGEVQLLDTFNAANNLPDLLFALISGGALGMAFIPLLTEYLTTKDRAAAWDLFSRVANIGFLVTGSIAIVIAIFAQQIVDAEIGIAPGFDADQRALLAELMRLNLIGTIIFSISGLVMASLQANQHFVLPALAPSMYNVGQIIGAIFLVPRFGIQGLVYGVILGAAFHLLIQIPGLFMYGFRWTPALDIRHTGLIEALKLMAPRLLTMAGIQIIFIARDNLASRLDQVGAVTSLTYGWMIMQVPETILGTAMATAMLPALSELASKKDWSGFGAAVERALRVLIALTLPIAAIMAAGIHPLVRGVFGFDEQISTLITWTTRAYLATLTGYTIHEIAIRAFYARKEPMVPLYAISIRLVIFLVIGILGVTFFKNIGAPVIAFSEIALLIEAIIILGWLSKRTHEPLKTNTAVFKGLIAAGIGGVVTYLIALYLPGGAIITALIGMLIGGGIALVIVWSEAKQVIRL
ncbi:MAG: murein biosynthesis integral membrane protein MurJ [Anaerolineales bacterium]|uniref:murein biosynthesis integral membrane protein MurJ n=1 Tax=Candidatus Villigracilis vicinus TaxID=3140679 RepID=UPI003136C6AA|nr:murein biosynthesis integral membrane protein MurJ [Anaerolineales bacterium]MBK7449703.1 murein biosynthesis integral membrane protein MurJ [Anaerolineales bacterium]MBK9782083.1 murein biosynthesis integral membrane protein MurJ [Anaerolineales bacterium]